MNNIQVIKRDASLVAFDSNKIKEAILKAMNFGSGIVYEDIAEEIASYSEDILSKRYGEEISIYDIESFVFNELIRHKQNETARAYENYRTIREQKREENTTDESIFQLINHTNKEVLEENSNKNGTLISTQRDLMAGEISKDIARRRLIPTHLLQAHDEGAIHIHDMDYMAQPNFNCCLINLEDMLDNGTVINEKMVESPKSFQTACTVATQIISQVASNQYGGQSITIKHLASYLRRTYDKYFDYFLKEQKLDVETSQKLAEGMKLRELKSGVQTINYQLNTLMTTNGQSPFITIYLEVEVGHKYEEEMALICEEIIKQRIDGMKNYKGQTISPAFPKLVYLLDEDNCFEGGKYDYITELAAYCTAKRLVPDYQSKKIMESNYGEAFPPMGCRSHLSQWVDENGKYKWYGRFNQGVVTLNLGQIGIIANGDIDLFWKLMDRRTELCKEALLMRHNLLKGTKASVSPIHWQYGAIARLNRNDTIDKYLMNGYSTLSLGYLGMYECVMAMFGVSHTDKVGKEFALEIMDFLNKKCFEWKAETNLGFSLYGTPAESTVYRFARIDRERFGEIKGVTDKKYYTNSFHVSITEPIDAFSKLDFEAEFQSLSLGGVISYVEVPDLSRNIKAVKELINYMYHNIQYAEINSKPDVCYKCGFTGEIQCDENLEWYCPSCGNRDKNEMNVVRRSCGYIGTNFWNLGRTAEIRERVNHL